MVLFTRKSGWNYQITFKFLDYFHIEYIVFIVLYITSFLHTCILHTYKYPSYKHIFCILTYRYFAYLYTSILYVITCILHITCFSIVLTYMHFPYLHPFDIHVFWMVQYNLLHTCNLHTYVRHSHKCILYTYVHPFYSDVFHILTYVLQCMYILKYKNNLHIIPTARLLLKTKIVVTPLLQLRNFPFEISSLILIYLKLN